MEIGEPSEVCIGHGFHVLPRDGMVRLRAEGEAPVWLEEVAFNAIQAVRADMRRSAPVEP